MNCKNCIDNPPYSPERLITTKTINNDQKNIVTRYKQCPWCKTNYITTERLRTKRTYTKKATK